MLKELFQKNKDIIINTDIDGFLSGMILQKYYGCKVVGFSNSRETIWVSPEVKSIYDPIYIDLYVNRPDVICIEQHIIAYDKYHHDKIVRMGNKINPNMYRKRTFVGDLESDYYHKYPFGTVHFLISLMAKEGIDVELGDLSKPYSKLSILNGRKYITCPGQVLLRADDALYSTLSPYRANALDWWHWLDPEKKSPAINAMRSYIDTCEISKAKEYKNDIGDFFKMLGCDGIDGAFKSVTMSNGIIKNIVLDYINVLDELFGIKLHIPTMYVIHKGTYAVQFCRPGYDMEILHASNLFSYAFIFGPNPKFPNFSYTLDMPD